MSIAPAGHVHNHIYSEQYYLAAIDSWLEKESLAQRIANRIGDTKTHYTSNTVLENAEDILDELEMHRAKEPSFATVKRFPSITSICSRITSVKPTPQMVQRR